MALRPINNALPGTPERPKKQAKVAVSINKKSDLDCVNDENKVPVPPSEPTSEATIDYIPSENLKPISDPEDKIQGLIGGLDSKDWIKVCESLNCARRFALHHSTLLQPSLEKLMAVLVKCMKNPRSALCKTSIMASSDIFNTYGDKLLESASFDPLLLQLLLKASQDKRFLCEEAERALSIMVESMNCGPLFHKLRAYVTHSNPRVRAKAAVCVSKMGLEVMKEFGLVSLLQMAANLLNDRLPEAREAARTIVSSIYEEGFSENEQEEKIEAWHSFCHSNLSPIHALSILKVTPPLPSKCAVNDDDDDAMD